MPRIKIFTVGADTRLRAELGTADRIDVYRTAPECLLLNAGDLLDAPVEVPETPPTLNMTVPAVNAASTDSENARLVFQYMPRLKPIYAADRRLWAALTHGTFWEYTRWRYSNIPVSERSSKYIESHWFVAGSGLASLRRNAVSRLWWAAWLTVAPWEEEEELAEFKKADRFHYTDVLLSSQQVYQDVMERDFGSSRRLRICFLDAFARHRNQVSAPDRLMKWSVRRLNLILEYRHLLTLPVRAIHEVCMKVVQDGVGFINDPATSAEEPEVEDSEIVE